MDFDGTFQAVSADATKLATRLGEIKDKGAPSLQLKTKSGRVSVSIFATRRDTDPDAIFGPAATDGTRPSAILNPSPGLAWVKFELHADTGRQLGRNDPPGKFGIAGKAGIGFGAYFRSPSSATLSEALRMAGDVPLVQDASDVCRLEPGQVAYLSASGTLSARLEFNWADVLTGEITPLRGLMPGEKPLNMALDLKAGLAVIITLDDSFRLVFNGVDKDYVAVSLNRASSNSTSFKAGASATVRLEKPDMARDLLASLAAQLLGVAPERINAARDQLEALVGFYDNAIEAIRGGIEGAAERLDALLDAEGFPLLLTRLQQLQAVFRLADPSGHKANGLVLSIDELAKAAKLLDGLAESIAGKIGDQLDEVLAASDLPSLAKDATAAARGLLERIGKMETALSSMARRRIERGVDFEYRRIATDATVLKARLRRDHADFPGWHRSLLKLDTTTVLAAATSASQDVVLDLFLNQKSIKRKVSLGLNLGWFYSDKDSAQTQWMESTRRANGSQATHRLALMGSRSREEKALGTRAKCNGQFDAQFASGDNDGSTGRWSFELSLAYGSEMAKADRRWLRALTDYACVWGVIRESESDWLVRTLEQDDAIGTRVQMEIALTVNRAAFANPAFLEALENISDSDATCALAVALQRMEQFPERAKPASRSAVYANAMSVLLGQQSIDVSRPDAVSRYVARHLDKASRGLKAFEAIGTRPIPAGSVAWLTQHAGSAMAALGQLKGAGALSQLVGSVGRGSPAESKLVSDAFRGLDLAWRDRFLLRWQVSLLRAVASRAGVSAELGSTLRVTLGASGKTRIITPAA